MQKNMMVALLAEELLSRQPVAVQDRLARAEFGQNLGLGSFEVLTTAGVRIRMRDLFSSARSISAENPVVSVPVLDQGEATIRAVADSFILFARHGEEIVEGSLEVLALLAEDSLRRQHHFNRIALEIGPTYDLSALRQVAQERPLSDKEVELILNAATHSASTIQAKMKSKLGAGNATLMDLVPDSLDYYERICGPDPGDLEPEEYFGSILPEFRAALLSRDFCQGLEICLVGALKDGLCPANWLGIIDNDQLWAHLGTCQVELDPFSLLAALDISLYRREDERFQDLSGRAVGLLTTNEFRRSDGVDCFKLIPALAKFVLNRIQVMENGALRQPFWKRMCAWMQATFVARWMHDSGVDVAALAEVIEHSLLAVGGYADSVDLRREPIVEAGNVSPFGLQREVAKRLRFLQMRHEAAGRTMPRIGDLEQAIERIGAIGQPLSIFLPGPLEGYIHRQQRMELPDELNERLLELSDEQLTMNLANLSQHFIIPEWLRTRLRTAISPERMEAAENSLEEMLALLALAARVAAAERDIDIAQAVADTVLHVAPRVREETLIWITETLVRSAAAFEAEAVWAEWLEVKFFEVANRFQAGNLSKLFWLHIQELKKVTRLDLGIFLRAESVASAAAF